MTNPVRQLFTGSASKRPNIEFRIRFGVNYKQPKKSQNLCALFFLSTIGYIRLEEGFIPNSPRPAF